MRATWTQPPNYRKKLFRITIVLAVLGALLVTPLGIRSNPAPKAVSLSTVSAPTTTTAVVTVAPTTTTTANPIPVSHVRPQRASRSYVRPVSAPPQPVTVSPEGCAGWGYKTRAESDACWGPIVASYGDWPTSRMLAIMYCESHGNPWVVNRSNHVGLFQIHNSNTKGNGPANIAQAHDMWLKSGTQPWVCRG